MAKIYIIGLMVENLVNTQILPFSVLLLLGFVFLLQIGFYWLIFSRLWRNHAAREAAGSERKKQPVSVVICAHNAHHQLKENLHLILDQDYPEFEVLVVNHSSDDDTQYFLNNMEEKYPNLKSINIREDLNFFSGKKFPLSIGIKSAKYEVVLLTDADCRPVSKNWICQMQSAFRTKSDIVLGYGPYLRTGGTLNRLIRFDTAHIAIQYLSYALAGIPYMGVGRNLSYKKQLFFKNNGFISHYRIKSGDDDLFINRVASRSNTTVMIHPESFVQSDPKETFGQWITQKRRQLSTSTYYKTNHKILLGLYAFSTVAFYTLVILMLAMNWSLIPVVSLLFLRLASQYIVFAGCLKRLNERDLVYFIPLYELMMILLNGGMMIANLFRKPVRWK